MSDRDRLAALLRTLDLDNWTPEEIAHAARLKVWNRYQMVAWRITR